MPELCLFSKFSIKKWSPFETTSIPLTLLYCHQEKNCDLFFSHRQIPAHRPAIIVPVRKDGHIVRAIASAHFEYQEAKNTYGRLGRLSLCPRGGSVFLPLLVERNIERVKRTGNGLK